MRREGFEILLSHAAQRGRVALARALAGSATDLEIFQSVGIAFQAQGAVAILALDVAIPQAGIFQHATVGVDGTRVLQAMSCTEIEYRPQGRSSRQRSSPAISP